MHGRGHKDCVRVRRLIRAVPTEGDGAVPDVNEWRDFGRRTFAGK